MSTSSDPSLYLALAYGLGAAVYLGFSLTIFWQRKKLRLMLQALKRGS